MKSIWMVIAYRRYDGTWPVCAYSEKEDAEKKAAEMNAARTDPNDVEFVVDDFPLDQE